VESTRPTCPIVLGKRTSIVSPEGTIAFLSRVAECHTVDVWVPLGIVLATGLSAVALLRSLQTAIPRQLATRLDELESQASRWRLAAEALIEEAESLFTRIERKRASASGAETRATRKLEALQEESTPQVPITRAQIRLARRAQPR